MGNKCSTKGISRPPNRSFDSVYFLIMQHRATPVDPIQLMKSYMSASRDSVTVQHHGKLLLEIQQNLASTKYDFEGSIPCKNGSCRRIAGSARLSTSAVNHILNDLCKWESLVFRQYSIELQFRVEISLTIQQRFAISDGHLCPRIVTLCATDLSMHSEELEYNAFHFTLEQDQLLGFHIEGLEHLFDDDRYANSELQDWDGDTIQAKDDDDNEEPRELEPCCICLTSLANHDVTELAFLPCNHILHESCHRHLTQYRDLVQSCPMCRQPLLKETLLTPVEL
ncbi:ring finger domain containing protein [Nitzschia inconspicua]|uniref:Ring finger domain containing protein n=1 Tax=Nitzschia inconspicua TaxID=303405 RepID=A0A9K3KJ02_9STRA|nr:ring finger domain containing protein [Nitzschia inconspicua]